MSLDPRFIIASDLQSLFRDKDSGEPLSNGKITFYKDQARTEPKSVYKLSGSPPNYSYTDLGNEITLNIAGTIDDGSGNDIILYYFPYDGTPDDSTGATELYYVTVYSEDVDEEPGILQFTREAWPNFVNDADVIDITNYIPNGQFLLHTDVQPNGVISQPVTVLSQGGWTFERPDGSTANDTVTFERFGSAVENPTGNPRYAIRIVNDTPSAGDSYKDLRLKFPNVNKFGSDTQTYTYAFEAQSNSGSNLSISLILIKNYGTGGSAQDETALGSFTIDTSYGDYNKSFVFGTNEDKTIGDDDDDFLQLALRYPVSAVFDISLTDFVLTPNTVSVTEFPPTPDDDFLDKSTAGWLPTPAHDGSDLYLPIKLGPEGFIFDNSEIGDVVSESYFSTYTNSVSTTTNRLLADGNQYQVSGYSPLGIPYARLWNKYWNGLFPMYGTGENFVISYGVDSLPTLLRIVTNTAGAVTATADGSAPTGCSFANIHLGQSITDFKVFWEYATNSVLIWANTAGTVTPINAHTSGFSVSSDRNSPLAKSIMAIVPTVATSLAGTYFTFSSTTTNYYVWYTVNGSGADPAPGGTGIRVNLLSTFDQYLVAVCTADAINGFQESQITMVAGSVIPASSFFTFSTLTTNYYVWYTVDGVGTDPTPAAKTGIPVAILSTDTAAQVVVKTQVAINSQYFATPDYRGLTFRNIDLGAGIDIFAANRVNRNVLTSTLNGDKIGTFEFDNILQHLHSITDPGHIHNITDPGHLHQVAFADNAGFSATRIAGQISDPDVGTQSSATATTGITVNTHATGITATNNSGEGQVTVQNVYVNAAIKY